MIDNFNFKNEHAKKSFSNIFCNKGIVGSIAEKAIHNYKSKKNQQNDIYQDGQIYNFAVGHAFKQINGEIVFPTERKEDGTSIPAHSFSPLFRDSFNYLLNDDKSLLKLIKDIRNIFSHFIHDFEFIKIAENNVFQKNLIEFLKPAFKLSLLMTLFTETVEKEQDKLNKKHISENIEPILLSNEEKDKILEEISSDECNNEKYILFTKRLFYQTLYKNSEEKLTEKQKILKSEIDQENTADSLIDHILFCEIEEDFVWKLNMNGDNTAGNHVHEVLPIHKGRYLSFEACLFILTLFLYKNEANLLVPKIRGFKKNGTREDASKIRVFNFFSKRFSSQDIDSNESNLVKFRDIINYLNKYPTSWNHQLALPSHENELTQILKEVVLELEIKRLYPDWKTDAEFVKFAKSYIGTGTKIKSDKGKLYRDIIELNKDFNKIYLNRTAYLNKFYKPDKKNTYKSDKKNTFDNFVLRYIVKNHEFPSEDVTKLLNLKFEKWEENRYNIKLKTNNPLTKLKKRISENTLITSYGRNQDRFIQFAMRYLAEINYFGCNAEFKSYKFYDNYEQDIFIKSIGEDKKLKDRLKYNDGKITDFITYSDHIKKYRSWEMPFVVKDNSVSIRISEITVNKEKNGQRIISKRIININRKMMIYFLNHAMQLSDPEGKGEQLLKEYYIAHQNDFEKISKKLEAGEQLTQSITAKRLLPSRYLQHKGLVQSEQPLSNLSLQKVLEQAVNSEQRYKDQLDLAISYDRKTEFEKKNKGRQFKLRFLKKAWNLMYFRETYLGSVNNAKGHHKQFHITRDEYNDFSKWMYAFDDVDVPAYKSNLLRLLSTKGFLENQEFRDLINEQKNLEAIYEKTKKLYTEWLIKNSEKRIKSNQNYVWENYHDIMTTGVFNINVAHFREFLDSSDKYKKIKDLSNLHRYKSFLIDAYYYSDDGTIRNKIIPGFIDKKKLKTAGTAKILHDLEALQRNRLEDVFLYKIALHYFIQNNGVNTKKIETSITDILDQEILFDIKKDNSTLYKLKVPFKQIDKYIEILNFNKNQKSKFSILFNLKDYIEKYKTENLNKTQKKLIEGLKTRMASKVMSFSDLTQITNQIVSDAVKFTKVSMAIEEYLIWKHSLVIVKWNRIDKEEIKEFKEFLGGNDDIRDIAFHFNLPLSRSYKEVLLGIETKWIRDELPENAELSILGYYAKHLLELFMEKIFDIYYDEFNRITDKKLKKQKAFQLYFENVQMKKSKEF